MTHQALGDDVDVPQLAGLLREAGRAEHDYLPPERITHYLSRLEEGTIRCVPAVRDGVLGAALLYSRFGPVCPVPGSFLRIEGLYVEEVMVTDDWRRSGWSQRLLARLRMIEGPELDVYIDCDAANTASVAMMTAAGYTRVAEYDDPDRAEPPTGHRTTALFRHPGRPATATEEW